MHLDNFISRLNVIPYYALTFFVNRMDNAVASISSVAFGRVRPGGRTLFFMKKTTS